MSRTENRIIFKIKTANFLKHLTPKKMKLLESTKNKITENKNGENVPHLESTEVILVHCNIFSHDYQQDWRFLYTFAPNNRFGKLFKISVKNLIFPKTFNSQFQEIKVWFTNQNNQPLETEDKINLVNQMV